MFVFRYQVPICHHNNMVVAHNIVQDYSSVNLAGPQFIRIEKVEVVNRTALHQVPRYRVYLVSPH